MKHIKRFAAVLMSSLLMLAGIPSLSASAEQAAEYTRSARYAASNGYNTGVLTDGSESTALSFAAGGTLTVTCEELIYGISLKFNKKAVKWRVTAGRYEQACG